MNYFFPSIAVDDVTQINEDILNKFNVKAFLLDIDNTLSANGSSKFFEGVDIWLDHIKQRKIKIIIISNNEEVRVKDFALAINADYYIYKAKKPNSFGFKKALEILKIDKENILVVGDQIFTDILGANLVGIKSILVKPKDKNEPFYIKFKRFLEIPFKLILKYKTKDL